MLNLKIEWKHLDVKGETCNRCYETGKHLEQEVEKLNRILQPKNVEINLVETILDSTQISQSNIILFNGVPIESILDIKTSENYCDSCSALIGAEAYCRTITYEGNEYEDIPIKAIRQAVFKVLGLENVSAPTEDSACGCKSSKCC